MPRTRKEAPPSTQQNPAPRSDEGIPYLPRGSDAVVNYADLEDVAARVVRLHVGGRAYEHVAEDAEGRWIYRYDR